MDRSGLVSDGVVAQANARHRGRVRVSILAIGGGGGEMTERFYR